MDNFLLFFVLFGFPTPIIVSLEFITESLNKSYINVMNKISQKPNFSIFFHRCPMLMDIDSMPNWICSVFLQGI